MTGKDHVCRCREREILVVYASLARKSFHLWKNFNFSRKNRVFESNSIQDIKNKEKKKGYYLFYLGANLNCLFLIYRRNTFSLERSISKSPSLIFLHLRIRTTRYWTCTTTSPSLSHARAKLTSIY